MLDTQIQRNHVYPSDVKRGKDALTHAIAGLTRDGHEPGPYKARMDAYFNTVQSRIDAAALQGKRSKIPTKIPNIRALAGADTIAKQIRSSELVW